MLNNLWKKGFVLVIIFLFIGASVTPITSRYLEKDSHFDKINNSKMVEFKNNSDVYTSKNISSQKEENHYEKNNDFDIQTVDSIGGVGGYTSITLDSNNHPHISYYDYSNGDLKYAEWTGSDWDIQTVDSNGNIGEYTSIDLDSNDHPHISYYDYSNYNLKYAKWTGSDWDIQTVDSTEGVGWDTSIVLDSYDHPHISYSDNINTNLKYAKWTGSDWDIRTVDSAGAVGWHTSIDLDSNDHPHISYMDYSKTGDGDLKYARWTGSDWEIDTVDSYDIVGLCTSIGLDSDDHPHISYADDSNGDLKYAKWTGSEWDIQTVDSNGNVGGFTSIVLDSNDHPHISYLDYSNGDLKYAKWIAGNQPPDKPTTPEGPTELVVGESGIYRTIACDPECDSVYYWFDWGDDTNSDWLGPYDCVTYCYATNDYWTEPGTYSIRVKAKDIYGNESEWSNTLTVNVDETEYPIADFSWYPEDPFQYKKVVFDAKNSKAGPSDSIDWYYWDLDNDGTWEVRNKLSHVGKIFETSGKLTITLKIICDSGKTDTKSQSIIINNGNQRPIAIIDYIEPSLTVPGETISFCGWGLDDSDITEYKWLIKSNTYKKYVYENEFSISSSSLPVGTYEVDFWVKDDLDVWSLPESRILQIKSGIIRRPPIGIYAGYAAGRLVGEGAYVKDVAIRQCGGLGVYASTVGWGEAVVEVPIETDIYLEEHEVPKKVTIVSKFRSIGGAADIHWTFAKSYMYIANIHYNQLLKPTKVWLVQPAEKLEAPNYLEGMLGLLNILLEVLGFSSVSDILEFFDIVDPFIELYQMKKALESSNSEVYNIKTDFTFTKSGHNILYFYLGARSWGDLGGVATRFGSLEYIMLLDKDTKDRSNNISNNWIQIDANGPIDIHVTDPGNFFINQSAGNISEAYYMMSDVDNNSMFEDYVYISNPINGTYSIIVFPNETASPEDLFNITFFYNDETYKIAENVSIADIPTDPYTIDVESINPPFIKLDCLDDVDEINGTINLNWSAFDYEDTEDLLVSIYCTSDDQETWEPIAHEVPNTGNYCWDTKSVPDGVYKLKFETMDTDENIAIDTSIDFLINNVNNFHGNEPPNKPECTLPMTVSMINEQKTIETYATDNSGDKIYYLFDWGDGSNSGWLGSYYSGESCMVNHTWSKQGQYNVQISVKDEYGMPSNESENIKVHVIAEEDLIRTYAIGFISNLYEENDFSIIETNIVPWISLKPLGFGMYSYGEIIAVLNNYYGYIYPPFIIGKFNLIKIT